MSINKFSSTRIWLLFKQHFLHNSQYLLLSVGAYVGVIFIILSFVQINELPQSNNAIHFQELMSLLVPAFGILYVGHSFPAFRSKESTIHYLMIPASVLEKFVFEFVSRIGITLLALPLLYWITFHVQGYFFSIFTENTFEPVGIHYLVWIEDVPPDYQFLVYTLITGGVLFALSLAFAGAAMFTKQPLIKSLSFLGLIILFFAGYSYMIIEPLGLGDYNPPDQMWLLPLQEENALTSVAVALYAGTAIMLFISYRKLKEREV